MSFIRLILLLVTIFFISSCSSDDKIKDQGISVFQKSDSVIKDKSLAKIAVKIPKMKRNHFWFGQNSDNNGNIENFSFNNKISKKDSIFSGFRLGKYKHMVFAPVIAQDKIFTINSQGFVVARDLKTYKKVWKRKIIDRRNKRNYRNGKISYDNNKIFVSTGYNNIVALDSRDGGLRWSKEIGSVPISTPISDKNMVFVITNDNKTYAFNSNNGDIIWVHSGIQRNTGILGSANPVIHKDYVIISYSSGEVYLLNKITGGQVWSHDLNVSKAIGSDFILNDIDATPIAKKDVAYVIGNGGLMMAILVKDGSVLWQKSLSSISDFWVAGDFIYLINNDNQLICLYAKNGKVKWFRQFDKYKNDKKPSSKIVYNGIIMAGDNLVISNSNREILLISPKNGEIVQTKRFFKRIYHTPIIVDNKMYVHILGRFFTSLKVFE